jgi:hypothetical protein
MPDIDIDFPDRSQILDKIPHRVARLENGKKHNTGIYTTEIPHNPVNGLSTVDYREAEERGYFKLDFLNVSIYQAVRDEAHLNELARRICGSTLSFKRAWGTTEKDLPYFRGTISCRPEYDPTIEEALAKQGLEDYFTRNMEETRRR